ncbi:MAG: heme exporter protein CcmB [Pseudomonadales bacterium]
MLDSLAILLPRELLLSLRHWSDSLQPVWFFLLVVLLFPLSVGPDSKKLMLLAPGLIWVIALLAVLLTVDGLFRSDYADGSLEQMLLSSHSLYFLVLAKLLAQSLILGLPLLVVSPLLALLLGLPTEALPTLLLSLLTGLPALIFIGAIGAALTVGFQRGGLLLSLLILPFYLPVLIFGAGAVQSAAQGFTPAGQLAMLAALLLLAMALAPLAVAASLRLHYYY